MKPIEECESLTAYEELSRRIGFYSKEPVAIPSVDVAKNLLKLVKVASSIEAAEAAMKVVRFSPSPKTEEEKEAKRICCEASQCARQSFGGD